MDIRAALVQAKIWDREVYIKLPKDLGHTRFPKIRAHEIF